MEIVCASCGADQPVEDRFCSSCGAALYRACPSCGADVPASAAFCAACGYALRDEAQRAAPAGDERQERRVVTVLFADLAGSTALGERLDPEDVRELQGELFDLVNGEVERFGGITEKFVGDAVLAVFGIPRAHEDDPERAVRAALATQDAFGGFAARVRERHSAEVALRIGVNTGEVVAGREAAARGELMVSGDAVNVAARLQQAAEPGTVLVGDRTRTATARAVRYESAGSVDAKGKREPVVAWKAVAAGHELGPRGVEGFSARLIGRDEELTILTALARRVERERAPQLVTLYGAAGVGKSRLLAELVQRLPGAVILRGRCPPYGEELTYWALAEAAKTHAGVLDSDSAATAREKLRREIEELVGDDAERVLEAVLWTIGLALPTGGGFGQEVTQSLHDAWRRYCTALGRDRLAILAVEDVHWATPQLLDLIERLADAVVETSLLVVCTARPELLEVRPTWGAAKQNATALALAPLDGEQASELVSSLLGGGLLPEPVRERVLARAEGNPFFVEEMLQMLIERRALVRWNGGWERGEGFAEDSLPDSVHGVIAARIDLLEADTRDALRRCSVIGRFFWPAAAGVEPATIDALGRRGLVAEQPSSSMEGMREYAFKHALTREVAYASLPRSERRILHRQVAEWIQNVAPDRDVETAELAAYHYGEALAHGEDDPLVARRASELLLRAAGASFQLGTHEVAKVQLERVLELAADDGHRAAALLLLAQVDVVTGGGAFQQALASALERLDSAAGLADPGDAAFRGDLLGWRSRVLWLLGRWEEAMTAADAAVETMAGLPESPQLARVLTRRSQLAMLRDDPDADELAREALAVARRVGDRFAVVNARINVLTTAAMDGVAPDPVEALEILDEAAEAGAFEEAFRSLVNFTWSSAGHLPVDEVLVTIAEGQRRFEGMPAPAALDVYLPVSICVIELLPAGRWDEIDALLAGLGGDRFTPSNLLPWLGLTAQLASRRGDLAEAGTRARRLREIAVGSDEPQRIVPMACALLPVTVLTGQLDELRAVATEVLELLRDRWGATGVLPAVRALARAGELDLLRRWVASLERDARPPCTRASIDVANALLAVGEGRPREAATILEQVVDWNLRLGYAFDAAAVSLDLATALDAAGDRERAAAVRAESEAFMRSIGCVHPI